MAASGLGHLDPSGRTRRIALHAAHIETAVAHRLQQLIAQRVLAGPRHQYWVRTQRAEMTRHVEWRAAQHVAVAKLIDQSFAKGNHRLAVWLDRSVGCCRFTRQRHDEHSHKTYCSIVSIDTLAYRRFLRLDRLIQFEQQSRVGTALARSGHVVVIDFHLGPQTDSLAHWHPEPGASLV